MVKKRKIEIPMPKSYFMCVECPQCSSKQIVFSHATTRVKCLVCGKQLLEPTGGKAKLLDGVKVLEKYGVAGG